MAGQTAERRKPSKQERRAAARERPSALAFVHIPKTAGATVQNMLAAAYTRAGVHGAGNYMRAPEATIRRVEGWSRRGGLVTIGHVPYPVFRDRLRADTRYMTFLREPVDRVLSHYFRHTFAKDARVEKSIRRPARAQDPASNREERWKIGLDLLPDALAERPELSNLATRFLCDDPDPPGELPEIAIYGAKANLRRFAFVGIQEQFEQSVERLQAMLGLNVARQDYEDQHVSLDRPRVEDLSAEQRALILEHNQLDAELYEFAVELFG
jgi:hypothetical protein